MRVADCNEPPPAPGSAAALDAQAARRVPLRSRAHSARLAPSLFSVPGGDAALQRAAHFLPPAA